MSILHLVLGTSIFFLTGCAAAPKTDCSKEDISNWLKSNRTAIRQKMHYPPSARERGWEGNAVVSLSINEDGSVKEGSVRKSTGAPILDLAALNIKSAKFSPPLCGGVNASIVVDIPIQFSLGE